MKFTIAKYSELLNIHVHCNMPLRGAFLLMFLFFQKLELVGLLIRRGGGIVSCEVLILIRSILLRCFDSIMGHRGFLTSQCVVVAVIIFIEELLVFIHVF